MKKVITIGGSNSKNSINKTFASYAANQMQNIEVEVLDLNDFELPVYGIDLEEKIGIPENAIRLNTILESADGFVISLAEHNGSYTAYFKNILDWLSRIDIKIWKDKPILLLATSPGPRGGRIILQSVKDYFPFLGGKVVAEFSLPNFYDNFADNSILDKEQNQSLTQKISLFEQGIRS